MEITWPGPEGGQLTAPIPANLQPFIEALGIDEGAEFLLHFRNKNVSLNGGKGQERSAIAKMVGLEKANRLNRLLTEAGYGKGMAFQVPGAGCFLARYLRSKGLSINEISNRLGRTCVSVRGYLRSDEQRRMDSEKSVALRLHSTIDEAVALGLVVRVDERAKRVRPK